MQLVYGTGNPAKIAWMQQQLAPIGIELVGIKTLDVPLPKINESGNTPLENAVIKAQAYFNTIKRPVFSADSGLYFDGVPSELQPGVNVRRVCGRELSDAKMTEHYAALARRFGGKLTAQYKNAICLVISDTESYTYEGSGIHGRKFYLVDTPHKQRMQGFPLDCLAVRIDNGRYYYDDDSEDEITENAGFTKFFRDALAGRRQSGTPCNDTMSVPL